MMSEIVLCPKCNGNGKFYSPAQTTLEPANHCNVCDGKGAVRPLDFATLGNQEQRISDLEQREKDAITAYEKEFMQRQGWIVVAAVIADMVTDDRGKLLKHVVDITNEELKKDPEAFEALANSVFEGETLRKFGGE